ncbi:MAG: hypothetical protein AABX33_03030 [Nanoarchaeota archaeon]
MVQGDYPLSGKYRVPDYSKLGLDSLMVVNRKFGESEVDLAVEGWAFRTNVSGSSQAELDRSLGNAKAQGLELDFATS